MLDLEVVPERSLGNEEWEFVLGKLYFPIILYATKLWHLAEKNGSNYLLWDSSIDQERSSIAVTIRYS